MSYEYDNDDDGYEMADDGAVIKSPHQQVSIHRSGSIHISSLGGTGKMEIGNNNNNNNNSTSTNHHHQPSEYNYNTLPHPQPPTNTPPTHVDSPSPPPTAYLNPSMSNDSSNTITTQLGDKIRRQAAQLQELQAAMNESQAYARLCEQRVCDLHPDHPLPVTEDSLGVASPQSRNNGGRNNNRPAAHNTGGVAKLRREKVALEQATTQLEKQLRTARTKVTEASRNLKEVRQQANAKDRELSFQRKKILKLEGTVQQMEVDVRSSAAAVGNPSLAASSIPNPSDKVNARNASLEKELTALRQSLQSEARTSEEQRVYIAVLESAVQAKATDMGLDKGQANLLTRLARLQGELSAKSREQEQSDSALKAFEVEMEDIRKREEKQAAQSNEQENKIHQLSERLTQFGRGEDDLLSAVKNLESEKAALLDYVEDNAARVADLSHQVQVLENEKLESTNRHTAALREQKQRLSEIKANKELLHIKTTESQAACASAVQDADSLRVRLGTVSERNQELEEDVQQHMNDITELREVQNELLETIREKTSAASASARELGMIRREQGSSDSEITTLTSKLNMLQIRMDAQKDLLRQDAKTATDALESDLERVLQDCAEYQTQLARVKEELTSTKQVVETEKNTVLALEDVRDELVGERDAQTDHLRDLTEMQEGLESTLYDAMDKLEKTEEELIELRSVRQACDRLNGDLKHMSLSTSGVPRTVFGSSEENHKNKTLADQTTLAFASWCRTDAVSRQLRLANMPSLATGVAMLGEQYQTSKDDADSAHSEKEVITRTLQDEIHGLRASKNMLENEMEHTNQVLNQERQRLEALSDELQDNQNELRDTRTELERTTCDLKENAMLLRRLTSVEEDKQALDLSHAALVLKHEDVALEFERLKEHSANLDSRAETLGSTCDTLRTSLEQARNDTVALQNEHRMDRQVFNEKIDHHSKEAMVSNTKADDLERRCLSLENELNMVRTRLDEESNGRERYTGESKELRGQVMRLEQELNRVNSLNNANKESDGITITTLERRATALTDQKEMMEASVVSLTTEIESVRRTLVRAVDDVCTKYAHQSQPVSVFVRSRSSKSGRPVTSALGSPPRRNSPSTKPGKRGFGTTSTNSISAPQVDGVRGAVRDMSTLLHALASTSIAQHEAEQQELRSVQQRTSSVETELRRAHDLLSTARRQHEGTLQSTTSELSSERERNRQLDGVVRQLRDNANRTSATNSELKHRISELDNNLVKAESDLANLRVSLSTAQQEVSFSREECDQLRQALRDTQDQASQLKREVENGNMEMENLEETVSNELSSLSEQHQLEVDRSRNYKDELDQMSNVLRNCRLDLEEVRNNNRHLKTEMQTTNENHSLTMNEQVHRSENDIAQLNMTLNGLKNQMETDQLRQENTLEALRAELSSAEATAGMLREQNEQLMEEKREATSEANRASNALSGQEALSRAEHAQNEALQHRVENLENELSR